ncbi:hypothetical protein G6F57_016975 [Rhizopus arrhizus]|nr:hypothetical protein G6F57_016975 [Rhizopus arrhizus]
MAFALHADHEEAAISVIAADEVWMPFQVKAAAGLHLAGIARALEQLGRPGHFLVAHRGQRRTDAAVHEARGTVVAVLLQRRQQAQRHLVALVAIQPFARLLEVEAAQRLHARPDPAPRPPAMQARAGQGALVGNKRDRLRLAMGSAQRRIVADHHLMAFFVVDEAVVQAGIFQQAADEGEVRFVRNLASCA